MPTTKTRNTTTKSTKTCDFGVVSVGREVVLCLPTPPSANRYWRNARGRIIVSEEAQIYKEQVGWLCKSAPQFSGDVAVSVTVFRARKAGDLDNFMKVLLDALKGIVYVDDKAVTEIHAYREDDKTNPRVMITAWEVNKEML